MMEAIYTFNGKDITMNVCLQIRAVVNIIQEQLNLSFEDAMLEFYRSETYKTLQQTENYRYVFCRTGRKRILSGNPK